MGYQLFSGGLVAEFVLAVYCVRDSLPQSKISMYTHSRGLGQAMQSAAGASEPGVERSARDLISCFGGCQTSWHASRHEQETIWLHAVQLHHHECMRSGCTNLKATNLKALKSVLPPCA